MSVHLHGPNLADPIDARRVADMAYDASEHIGRARPVIVAIDGPSAAGKSSLAELVAGLLGKAPVVHLDDLYPGWDGLVAGVDLLVEQILHPLHDGQTGTYRRFDWGSGQFAEIHEVAVTRFAVIEGCGSSTGEARRLTDVRVWVEATAPVRQSRGGARTGGYGGEWETWAAQERALFTADLTRDHAQLIIATG
ncbi:nucleoside/nucleotide kinase family protein [Calidifontibacter terrae]